MQIKEQVSVTDPGTKRTHNEDALLHLAPLSLFGIADGMGGGQGNGREAAETALTAIAAAEPHFALHRDQITEERSTTHRLALAKYLDQLFNQISRTIQSDAEEANHTKHTAALLLAMTVRNFAYIAHVGNCQAYLLRDGRLRRLNEDHSLASYRYRRGRLSHEEFQKSPTRHILYQSLGAGMEIDVDLAEIRLHHGDVLLLSSDGLLRALDEPAVRDAINPGDLKASSKRLLAKTKERGASDNVSFVLLSFASDEQDESIDVITDVMSNVFLFQNMSDAERMVIAPYLEEAVYDKDDIIINKGDLGDCFLRDGLRPRKDHPRHCILNRRLPR